MKSTNLSTKKGDPGVSTKRNDLNINANEREQVEKAILLGGERDRKLVEGGVQESEDRFRRLSEAAFEGICIHEDGRIIEANDVFARTCGYEVTDVIGMNALDLAAPESRRLIMEKIESEYEKPYEAAGLRKDGTTFPVEIRGKTILHNGRKQRVVAFRDITGEITERKEAELKLKTIEKRHKSLIENTNEGIATTDAEGKFTFVNKALSKMIGYSRKELIGKFFFDFLHPEDKERIVELFLGAWEYPERKIYIEFKVNHKKGHVVHLRSSPTIFKHRGKILGFNAIISDITAQKRAEEALSESEERFRLLFENASEGIIYGNPEGNILDVNPMALEISGYEREELLGKNFMDLYRSFKVDPEILQSAFEDTFLEKPFAKIEFEITNKKGKRFTLRTKPSLIKKDGEIIGIGVILVDISERKAAEEAIKESEEKYSSLVEQAQDGVVIIQDEFFRFVNSAMSKLTGYNKKELLKMKFPQLLTLENRKLVQERYKLRQRGKKVPTSYELKIKCKDGSKKDIFASVGIIQYHGKNATMGIIHDITIRKNTEKALKKSEKEYRDLVDNALVGVYKTNLKGKILYANEGLAKIFDYNSPVKMMSNGVQVTYKDKNERDKLIEILNEKGKVSNFEIEVITNIGKIKNILCSASLDGDIISGMITDITEHKLAEEKLLKHEQEIRMITNNVPALVSYVDRDGYYRFVNKKYEEWFELASTEIIGKHYSQVLGDDTYKLIKKQVDKVLSGGEVTYEEALPYKHGGTRWVIANYVPDMDKDGNVKGFFALVTDITDRKRIEEALYTSQERYELSTKAAKVGVWDWNKKTNEFYIDPIVKEILGYNAEEIPNDMEAWSSYIHPDDKKPVMAAAQACLDGNIPEYVYEHRMMHKDSTIRWVLTQGNVIRDVDGNAIRLIGTDTDITERKLAEEALRESEKKYKDLFEKSPEAILLINQDFKIIDCNDAAARIGGAPRKEVIGKYFGEEIIPILGEDKEEYFTLFVKGLQGEPVAPFEVKITNQKGETYWLETHLSPPEKYEDNFVVQIIAHDITETKKAENELKRYQEHLEELVAERTTQLLDTNAELEAFAYSVSHDLRAPLRGMQGFAQILLEDYGKKLDAEGKRYAHRIVDASQHMKTMIENLLSYSRLSRAELKLKPIDLNKILKIVLKDLEARINETKAEINVEHILPEVNGHSITLIKVLTNLLINAIIFVSPDVKPKVKIRSEEQNGRIRLLIEDNGIGIAPEYQDKIFRIFERLHGIETYPGTGIGLAIVRKGMERMNGRVGVESALGKCSKFWVELEKVELKK